MAVSVYPIAIIRAKSRTLAKNHNAAPLKVIHRNIPKIIKNENKKSDARMAYARFFNECYQYFSTRFRLFALLYYTLKA